MGRELVRLLRDGYLKWSEDGRVVPGTFLRAYMQAPASAQSSGSKVASASV